MDKKLKYLKEAWELMEDNSFKIIYNAYVLTENSKEILIKKFPPKFDNKFYHHMTLNFDKQELPPNLGSVVTIKIVGYAEDEKAHAVIVDEQLESGRIAHVTLSCDNGVKPVYSNTLIKSGWDEIEPFTLEAKVMSFTDNGWKGDNNVI